jgi:hypothetical protein
MVPGWMLERWFVCGGGLEYIETRTLEAVWYIWPMVKRQKRRLGSGLVRTEVVKPHVGVLRTAWLPDSGDRKCGRAGRPYCLVCCGCERGGE